MSQAIPSPVDCGSNPCTPSTSRGAPGPQGATGAAGADGEDGVSAYAVTSLGTEAMPAEGATVVVTVASSSSTAWVALGEPVFVQFWGTMLVTAKSSTTITLENLEDTATGAYADNAAPGTILPVGATITPTGFQGPSGSTSAAGLLEAANNLNDVDDVAAARSNLGLGTAAIVDTGVADNKVVTVDAAAGLTDTEAVFATAAGIETKTDANARTALGLGSIATQSAASVAITGGSITGITDLAVADGGTGASTAAAARTALGVLAGYGLLASLTAVDLNTAGDNTLTMAGGRYIIDKVTVENASINLTTATAGVFTAVGGGGTTIAADQALSALTAATKFDDLTLQAVAGTDTRTEGTLYFRVGTPQGAAATANVFVYGYKLT